MEKYLSYLLADIAAAAENVPVLTSGEAEEGAGFIPLDEEEKMARREALGEWIGLKQEWFPPAARLNEGQIARLLEAMEYCLDAFNFIPHFPAGLPLNRRYEILVNYLIQDVPILVHNPWQIDFCHYDPKSCPFGASFCQCRVYEQWLAQMDDGTTDNDSAHPSGLPDFLFEEDEEGSAGMFYEEDEEFYDEDEDNWEEDDDEDDPFFFGLSDFEPGPDDDDGCWN